MIAPVKSGMIDFDEAFLWLNVNDFNCQANTSTNIQTKKLSDSTLILCRKLDSYLGVPGGQAVVWETIGRLKNLARKLGNKEEEAEIFCRCARAVFHLGNYQEAENYLREAIGRYKTNNHNAAVALWLRGCIYWRLPGGQDDAIVDWQNSKMEFIYEKDRSTSSACRTWYDLRLQEMTDSMTIAIS